MGSQLSSMGLNQNLIPENCKLHSTMPISSPTQQQQMTQIIQKRIKLSQCPYICTAKGYDFINEQTNRLTCNQQKRLIVYYDHYDFKLIDVSINNYRKMFDQGQLCLLIRCITLALMFMKNLKLHHGDVSLDNICKKGKVWRLIDKIFLKNGINAYQKVLEGQSGFISPKQMLGIRHGQIKESPKLEEADDIFSLGMVILQLASQVPSSLCYRQTRFNEDNFNQNLYFCRQKYSEQFYSLLCSMLRCQEQQRIKLNQILTHPLISSKQLQNSTGNISLSKIRASQLGQSTINSRSQVHINTNLQRISGQARKPLTPSIPPSNYNSLMATQQTSKQLSPALYSSSKTISMKSSQYFGNSQPIPQTHRPHPSTHTYMNLPSSTHFSNNTNARQAYEIYYGKQGPPSQKVLINPNNTLSTANHLQYGNTFFNDPKRSNSFISSPQRLKTVN